MIRKPASPRPLVGLAIFAIFALCLLFGVFYGDKVVWKFKLDPYRDPMPILMYHHMLPDGSDCNDMTVTPSKLRQDFDYIRKQGYTPVLPRELLDPDSLPDKPILITFDDGYTSNYNLLYPILQEYNFKALISPIVCMPDLLATEFCSWDMYREMIASGLVEIGSHTYRLHNLDVNGSYKPGEPNGIQRLDGETDAEFQERVLDDIQKSYDRLTEELGVAPTCFAYPFGAREPDADALIDSLFPVSLLTWSDTADLYNGTARMPRWTVTMWEPVYNLF